MDQQFIRNFCIIAHIDHGKSTLADRFLEYTGTIAKQKMREQFLDQMDLERERGITIKMQPVRMVYHANRGLNADLTQNNADLRPQTHAERPQNNADGGQKKSEGVLLYDDLTYKIRGVLFDVRKKIGLGHKEQVYQNALEIEFKKAGIVFESKKNIPLIYEGKKIGIYQPDFVIENKILLELKALPEISRPQTEQIWSYLKGCDYKLALLVNYGSKDVEIKRVIYDTARHSSALSALSPRVSAQIENYVLNLIDTPGHVDFQYEVSRSIAACEGAVLVVDAVQGIQAQTIANLYLALEQNLKIIPVINKIDLPNARVSEVKREIVKLLGVPQDDILTLSAKTGEGVPNLLARIILEIPPPLGGQEAPFQALIFDSIYDVYQGVVVYVRVRNGKIKIGDKICFLASKREAEVLEVGTFSPQRVKCVSLSAGEVGYIVTGIKEIKDCRVGDTVGASLTTPALVGYREIRPMVFASFFPEEAKAFIPLREGLEKLQLNDASLRFEPASSLALGRGFHCGFLGLLHMEIIHERLQREFGLKIVVSVPSVAYQITIHHKNFLITNPAELPDPSSILKIEEPWVRLEILTPVNALGAMMELCQSARGVWLATEYLDSDRAILRYELPLAAILTDFYDRLKARSSGYASMSYDLIGFRAGDLVRLDILLNSERADAFTRIVPRVEAEKEGRRLAERLKQIIPKHTFAVPIQAAIGGKIIARETIPALRKDVTAKLYGGDVTRKRKLLEKQKKGKKKMQDRGKVVIPQKAFLEVLKKGE